MSSPERTDMHSLVLHQAVELQTSTTLVLVADFSDSAPCRQLCRLDLHHHMDGLAGMSASRQSKCTAHKVKQHLGGCADAWHVFFDILSAADGNQT